MVRHQEDSAPLAAWLAQQKAAFEMLSPRFESMEPVAKGVELWRSYMSFWSSMTQTMPPQAGAIETALEALIESGASSRASHDMMARLAQAPSLATLWDWDKKSVKTQSAWRDLQKAIVAHQAVLDRAWAEASSRFIAEIAQLPGDDKPPITSWQAGLQLWLSLANETLLRAQRRDEFLATQRQLLRATLEYRLQLGKIAEEFCEFAQIPGRREVDELARLVHELRREVRELKRARAELPPKSPGH